jgi:hypothetical protein
MLVDCVTGLQEMLQLRSAFLTKPTAQGKAPKINHSSSMND